MVINIVNKSQFVNGFLKPISALTESVVIKSLNNKLVCVANNEQGFILCATYNLDMEDTVILNIPNVKRLEKVISFIGHDSFDLKYQSNALSYKDSKIRFKYHFLDDNIIQSPKLSLKKISQLESDVKFTIGFDKITELAKGAAFVSESEKLYFNVSENGVYGEITDKTNSSVDSYEIQLSDESVNADVTFPVHFDIVRLLTSSNCETIDVSFNTSQGFCIFDIKTSCANLKYIVSGLQS
jgi:hypothetical protein